MGFYVNVHAKQGCSRQINSSWKKQFGGHLVFTPSLIKHEIEFIKNDPKQHHLLYVNTIKIWDETFPIHANGRGQVFIRALGYDEDEAEIFVNENNELIEKIKFILDHRLLFSKISGLQDAVDSLNMNINGDFIENGKIKYYTQPSFENLPKKNNNPIYIKCLILDRPDLWESYLKFVDDNTNWTELRHKCVMNNSPLSKNSTIWQRCEKIAKGRDGIDYGLKGRYQNGLIPNEFDITKAIVSSEEEFEAYCESIKRGLESNQISKNSDNIIAFKVA